MRRFFAVTTLAAALWSSIEITSAQSGSDLFQKALSKERVDGQLTEAIALYHRILKEFAADRALAAKALLQIGRCYERLGDDDGRKAYERIVREYADQHPTVDEARDRLASMTHTLRPAGPSMRLVLSGRIDTRGTPSPDGRYLSHVDYTKNPNGDLAIREVATGQTRRLTEGDAGPSAPEFAEYSVFAPDSRQIAYSWFNKDGFRELRVTRIDRPRSRTVYRNPESGYLEPAAWSPDGQSIVTIFERPDGSVEIGIVSVAAGTKRVIKTLTWMWPHPLSVSPDGRFIAYAIPRDVTFKHDIFLLAADGSRETPLVTHPADDRWPFWTPDGAGVVFASDRSGAVDAWFVPVADGRPGDSPTIIKRNLGRGAPMGLTRSGALYYAVHAESQNVHVGTIDPVSGRAIGGPSISERFVGANYGPDWSPDGTRLSYISRRGVGGPGSSILVVRSLAGDAEQELVPRLQYFHRPRWAPDGTSLVAQGRGLRGPYGLFTIDAKTAQVATLVASEPDADATHQVWSADGRTLFYTAGERIVARDAATGTVRIVADEPGTNEKAISPDGQWLAFQRINAADGSQSSIRLVPVTGGPVRVLVTLRGPEAVYYFGGLNWTADGKRLLFVKRTGERRELLQVRVDSGVVEPTGLAPSGLTYVRLHPDGKQLAYTAGRRQEEIWVIERFLPGAPAATPTTSRRQRER